jgi:hypothetical protein
MCHFPQPPTTFVDFEDFTKVACRAARFALRQA